MDRQPGPERLQNYGTDPQRSEAHSSSIATQERDLVRRHPQTTPSDLQNHGPEPNQPRRSPERESPPGAKLKRVSSYSKYVMSNIFSIVVAYYSARQDIAKHAEKPTVVVCGSLVFITFLADLILMLHTSCLLTLPRIGECRYMAAIVLIYVSNVLFMLTSVGLLVLLNKSYAFLAVLLLPIIAILGIFFRKEIRTARHQRHTGYEAYETELKQFSDLSVSVTFLNFTGMIATISFYFKNFPEKAGRSGITVSESFIFFTIIFGLLSMLLTTVPPSFKQRGTRERLISVIRAFGYVLFGLQTLTGLELAAGFVEGFVVLAFLPDFVGAVFWFDMEFLHERRRDVETGGDEVDGERGRNDEPETFAIPVASFIFTLLMTVYSMNRGAPDYNFHLRSCMLLIFSAFKSSLSWMMLTFKPPKTQSLVTVANILTRFTVGLLVVAMLDVILFAIPAIYKFF
ncbi:uncharacterized protein [Elaeis guineensis]|uniref:Uncharacterized protein LOC105059820 n=1 Tax=Elaeis guineensis var. tenera TaxID=51953 RepID=A0A6I9SDP6_ELAGV|nr:uncharacterized protein LOC105059820 [Elaeis guineensis]